MVSGLPPPPPVSANLLRLETTQGSVGACHLEVSTFPDRIRSRKIWNSDRSGTAIRLSGTILPTKLVRHGGSASAAG